MLNIFVVGYYNHNNIGDEQYKETFQFMFDNCLKFTESKISYIDCDVLKDTKISDNDVIILGGGDILNNYFIDEIIKIMSGKPNKIIAVSVGLPYSDILTQSNKLSIIDYIFLRTKQDMELFSQYFREDRLFYLPDISYFLLDIAKTSEKFITINNRITTKLKAIKKKGKKIIAFSLNRHIYTKETEDSYHLIVLEFAKTVKELIKKNCFIVFLPFNTYRNEFEDVDNANMENDTIFHTDICKCLHEIELINVMNIEYTLTVNETFVLYNYFYMTVPMRFHACLFSIYKNIPMMPVFTTKKIKNFLLDINWDGGYELKKNSSDIPIKMDSRILLNKIYNVISHHEIKTEQLMDSCKIIQSLLYHETQTLIDRITIPYKKVDTMGFGNNKSLVLIEKLKKKIKNCFDIDKETIVSLVSYYLTNSLDSKYNHGLYEKMFSQENKFNYKEEWLWIIKDVQKEGKKIESFENGLFNMNFIDQIDYSGTHRSGWQYVIENIKSLNNENIPLYMDLSVDKTFHWKSKVNEVLGIIPYKSNWVGFIHHTFDETFSDYNNTVLLKNKLFQESLINCKGLFTLSNKLKDELINELSELGLRVPPIHVLCHPTESNGIETFSWKKFIENNDKKIINIGGWLRNIYSFYNLLIPDIYSFEKKGGFFQLCNNTMIDTMRKVALKGRSMDNYYPIDESFKSNENNVELIMTKSCCHNNKENNWNKHRDEYNNKICKSVDIIEHLSNEDYDDLLSKNIVFLHLVDASTVNTILECIVRNTPIIVNKNKAVVELLGEDYPLYYEDSKYMNKEIYELLSDTDNIKAGYKYLLKMNKEKFSIEYFMKELCLCLTTNLKY
jgi:polysaccharide pyruvyl transferase WcaK-like protein